MARDQLRTHPDHPAVDLPADQLDDAQDRDELRQRYYGLLQELRVLLPGVQVLVAFLLTVPFAARFEDLDDTGLAAFAVAMLSGLVAVVCLLTPTAFHRVAERTARSVRLVWAIRMVVVGLAALSVALLSALFCVSRYVFGTPAAVAMTAGVGAVVAALWVALPLAYRHGAAAGLTAPRSAG